MAVFPLKQNDTLAILDVELLDPPDENGVQGIHDLTGAIQAWLHIKLADGSGTVTRAMTSSFDATGIVSYAWAPTDWTGTPRIVVGVHDMEYEILGPSGARHTFPNASYDKLSVIPDLGQATSP